MAFIKRKWSDSPALKLAAQVRHGLDAFVRRMKIQIFLRRIVFRKTNWSKGLQGRAAHFVYEFKQSNSHVPGAIRSRMARYYLDFAFPSGKKDYKFCIFANSSRRQAPPFGNRIDFFAVRRARIASNRIESTPHLYLNSRSHSQCSE